MTATQIKPRPVVRQKPKREPKYLAWLRKKPCTVCGKWKAVEAAHTGARGSGLGVKSDDRDAIPLCEGCHRTNTDSYHAIGNEPAWERLHVLNLPRIRERLRAEYERRAA